MSRRLRKEMTYVLDLLYLWSYVVGLWKDHWFWDKKELSFSFTSPTYNLYTFR